MAYYLIIVSPITIIMTAMISLVMILMMLTGNLSEGEQNIRISPETVYEAQHPIKGAVRILPERMAEEDEISDIPFNTIRIAEQMGFDLRGMLPVEEDINDLPFNTAEIVRKHRKSRPSVLV